MQGKFDKRGTKGSVRPEDMTDRYFDDVVKNAADFLEPYTKHIIFMGAGNHEGSVLKRAETDLLERLSDMLFHRSSHRIMVGQYHGWIYIKGKMRSPGANSMISYTIYHNHGTGGDAAVTGGAIEDHRKMTHVEGADAIWMGHNHNKYSRQQAVHY
jgi:hypothetical protein